MGGGAIGDAIVNDSTWDFESKLNGHTLMQVPGLLQIIVAVAQEHHSMKVLRYLQGICDRCDTLPPPSPTASACGSDISSPTEPDVTLPISARRRVGSAKARKRRWSR